MDNALNGTMAGFSTELKLAVIRRESDDSLQMGA